jgi:hypothetical protein
MVAKTKWMELKVATSTATSKSSPPFVAAFLNSSPPS